VAILIYQLSGGGVSRNAEKGQKRSKQSKGSKAKLVKWACSIGWSDQ